MVSFWPDKLDKSRLAISELSPAAQELVVKDTQALRERLLDYTFREANEILEQVNKELARLSEIDKRLRTLMYELINGVKDHNRA